MQLGKQKPKIDNRTLLFGNYLSVSALPTNPYQYSWAAANKQWYMRKNDSVGCCTIATAGHMIQNWTANLNHNDGINIPDDETIKAYIDVTSKEGHAYNPNTHANDRGCAILDVLNYWRQHGINNHYINAYMKINKARRDLIELSTYLFGATYIGVALPKTAQNQDVWDLSEKGDGKPYSWGGHCVPIIGYDPQFLTIVTWGAIKKMTWAFFSKYCDESYALLSMDWINQNKAPNGFLLSQLQMDLASI